ncbi:methyl jasmonate esterase 1-like [Salvia miltiorrhiza]|uniref:methyl jasmonate esterase 1-like n=1 Tax=Salvia miltiorrhiza TaxID=226208 RepID=UPI0025AD9393|nr:methyl jasmonate esterase 1-like [Salvia miltiorrhiza]
MEESRQQQPHFVVVHGACHGAWCWYKVATKLRAEGHRVTALDMAASGADPKRVEELSSVSEYCRPLIDFMAALPPQERVILVGHSMGGVCLSLAMENFPHKISVAVFVTAMMPGPDVSLWALVAEYGKQMDSYIDSQFFFNNGHDKPPTSMVFGPNFLATQLYQHSPPEDLSLATLLMRPMGLFDESGWVKATLSKQNHGSVRRVFVVCEQDLVLKKGFQEWMIENNPVDEVKIISGADHMPMFSKTHELCAHLHDIALKYCS